jgi:transposase
VQNEPPTPSPYAPDVVAVRAWLEEMIAALSFAKLIATILGLITRMRDINTELMKRVAHLSRKHPRSEKLKGLKGQLLLPLLGLVTTPSNTAPSTTSPPETKKPKKSRRGLHPGRGALPAHLERVPVVTSVPAAKRTCPGCGCEMPTMGYAEHETLELIPARFVVLLHKLERCACVHDDHIVSATAPPELVPGGKLGRTLIVEALCDKFVEHQPIERQCLRFERAGVAIASQTLGRSVAVAIDKLAPLAKLIEEQTRGPGLLGNDATSIPVLDRDAPDGIRMGTMWAWTNARWVAFFYSASGGSDSVRTFLGEDLCRTVQCDGTNVMTFLERAGGKPLFAIEKRSAAAGDTAEQRKARRLDESTPVLAELRAWLDDKRGVIPPKTPMGAALGYLHRQWKRLVLFLEDGNIELTNNRRERELRKLVLGRRNWLFTWKDLGGERTAHILSIVATAIAHDLNPRAYLHVVTRLLVEGWPAERLRELLPDRIGAQHPELVVEHALSSDAMPLLPAAA